jgi:membrane-bound lytic murein transglycosylase D
VKKGDTLAKIARRHHTTLAKLRAANGLGNDSVTIGEKIVIPSNIKPTQKPILTAATTNTNPATPNGTNTTTTPAQNTPFVSSANTPTPVPMKSYTVAHHDTMTRIAHKFHITTAALIAANPQITNAASLHIGDVLEVPAPKPKATPTPTPTPHHHHTTESNQ